MTRLIQLKYNTCLHSLLFFMSLFLELYSWMGVIELVVGDTRITYEQILLHVFTYATIKLLQCIFSADKIEMLIYMPKRPNSWNISRKCRPFPNPYCNLNAYLHARVVLYSE